MIDPKLSRFDYIKRLKRGEHVDWHVHTNCSDGDLSPVQIVRLAKKMGLKEIALADHDCVKGVAEAVKAGLRCGVSVVPNVEITVRNGIVGGEREIHMLALDINVKDPTLTKELSKAKVNRKKRVVMMVKKLKKLGYGINLSDVEKFAGGEVYVSFHVMQALLANKSNIEKMMIDFKLDHGPTIRDVYRFLIGRGKPGYVKRRALSPNEAIALIRKAGGIPVLAHPGLLEPKVNKEHLVKRKWRISEEVIRHYKKLGLKGVEVYFPEHSKSQIHFYAHLADKLGLVATAGSDFHGFGGNKKLGKVTPD
jgi:hypothetical protein